MRRKSAGVMETRERKPFDSFPSICQGVQFSKPFATVSDPPTDDRDRESCDDAPPERQHEVCDQAENDEKDPEDLFLHRLIVSLRSSARAVVLGA